MGPWRATPAVQRNLGAFSISTSGRSSDFADVWGRAPSTVTDGTAKGPDSDCRTHPCWVTRPRQTQPQPEAPAGSAGSQGPAPPVAGSHPLPPRPCCHHRRVAEHDKDVQQLCEVLEQQIQQEQLRLQQQVGPCCSSPLAVPAGGTQHPKPPRQLPMDEWVPMSLCHPRAWPGATSTVRSCSECWMPARGRCSAWSRRRWRWAGPNAPFAC